jgi:hypothetical protein
LQSELKKAIKDNEALIPAAKLFDSFLKSDGVLAADWRLIWRVQDNTSSGVSVGDDLPGGLTVVGAIGSVGNSEPVTFECAGK